jgi:hypothetical protein
MNDAEKLRRAVDEVTYVDDAGTLGPILVAEIKRLRLAMGERCMRAEATCDHLRVGLEAEHDRALLAERERDAILRWSIRHAGYLGTREDTDSRGRWWARGDEGRVVADTAEAVVRKAAGLEPEPASWDDE